MIAIWFIGVILPLKLCFTCENDKGTFRHRQQHIVTHNILLGSSYFPDEEEEHQEVCNFLENLLQQHDAKDIILGQDSNAKIGINTKKKEPNDDENAPG